MGFLGVGLWDMDSVGDEWSTKRFDGQTEIQVFSGFQEFRGRGIPSAL